MNWVLSGLGASALIVFVAWGSSLTSPNERFAACGSIQDAVRQTDRSRNGISVACEKVLTEHAKRRPASAANRKGESG